MNALKDDVWLGAIREREQLLGESVVRRMAEIFLEELDTVLAEAEGALKAGRTDAARRAIHHLGGSAGCLDFNDLAATVQTAELACVSGRPGEALEQMSRVSPMARSKAEQLRRHYRMS